VAQVEEQIIAAGAQVIWVLEQDGSFNAGTADACRRFVDSQGSDAGWCVGDGETEPMPGVWDDSPFARGRGTDVLVRRSDMRIVWTSNHGTPRGNENLTGEQVLEEVRRFTGR
jgi:hypothetical protein